MYCRFSESGIRASEKSSIIINRIRKLAENFQYAKAGTHIRYLAYPKGWLIKTRLCCVVSRAKRISKTKYAIADTTLSELVQSECFSDQMPTVPSNL